MESASPSAAAQKRWQRLSQLLDAALDLEPDQRAALVDTLRSSEPDVAGELAALLAAHESADGRLDGGLDRFEPLLAEEPPTSRAAPGDVVGRWRLLAVLGRGGMGEVHLAERVGGDFEQRVAVKLLRADLLQPALRERFARERRILARLEHPGIARLVDGGVAPDGSPFLAMEYVSGEPLVEWCRSWCATLEQRLRLLIQVCDAVQYAHGHLVVHRDLKPSNILVDAEGTPRLLDFGIAKLLEPSPEDATGEPTALRWLTPLYAAPEQITGGDTTAATDVYSLGVILYELLAGRRPFAAAGPDLHALERRVVDEEPTRPSSAVEVDASRPEGRHLPRRLRGDLDRITLRALAKEPERRYHSAEALAEDLRRYLAGQPVQARGDALLYRAAKFARRHRLAVAAVTALIAALAGGLLTTAWQARRAGQAAAQAHDDAALAQASVQFLSDLFAISDPAQSKGKVYTDEQLLKIALSRVEHDLAAKPALQAPLFRQLAAIFMTRGEHELGVEAAEKALAVERRLSGPTSVQSARDRRLLGNLLDLSGRRPERARALVRSAMETFEAAGLERSQDYVDALDALEQIEADLGHPEEQRRLAARAVELTRELHGAESAEYAAACGAFGGTLLNFGLDQQARPYVETAARLQRKLLGLENPDTLITLTNLATLEGNVGNDRRSREILAEILPIARRVLGPERQDYLVELRLWARLEERAGEFAPAIEALESVLATLREHGRDQIANYAFALNQLAVPILVWSGDLATAEARERQAVAVYRRAEGHDFPWLQANLAGILIDRGKLDEAARLLAAANAAERAQGDTESAFHAETLHGLGRLALAHGDRAGARRYFEQALEILRRQAAGGSRMTARALVALASTLEEGDHARRCRELLGEAARIDAQILGASHPERIAVERALAACPVSPTPPG